MQKCKPVAERWVANLKPAASVALAELSALLDEIRKREGLQERKLGIFYRKSTAFLHFHEDAAGMFADHGTR